MVLLECFDTFEGHYDAIYLSCLGCVPMYCRMAGNVTVELEWTYVTSWSCQPPVATPGTLSISLQNVEEEILLMD